MGDPAVRRNHTRVPAHLARMGARATAPNMPGGYATRSAAMNGN